MDVILLEDIKGLGKKGDLASVSDGHARNYLLPRKLAAPATKSNMNEMEARQKSQATKEKRELEAAEALGRDITGKEITIPVKAGEGGKLFGSVTNKEIAQALEEQHGFTIDRKKILVSEPIKSIGETSVDVKLHPKVTARLTVRVTEM